MGTPEFPNLGRHCSVEHCKQIDFLPFTCDQCNLCYCLEHRSYITHHCSKAGNKDVTVVICPLCAKGVRLIADEDPNISWEKHVNTECDPSNYEKVTKKKKCPVRRCKEILTFSNTIKCKDCNIDHCLKHRFRLDHDCPGPKKPDPSFPFMDFIKPTGAPATSSSSSSFNWATRFFNLASSFRENRQIGRDAQGGLRRSRSSAASGKVVGKMSIDVCPKCSKGFRDPVDLVEHVERDHGGASKK